MESIFLELCREKFKDYPKFKVVTNKFENHDLEKESYDLVYAASAFHWVPEEVGYSKVFSILKRGGVFARFANHPYLGRENTALSEEIDKIYDGYYYKFHNRKQESPKEYTEEQAKNRAKIAEKYGFIDIRYALFFRIRIFSAKEYTALLSTYSDHIVMEEAIRKEFLSEMEGAINRHGGTITIYDTIDLQLARKP